MTYDESIYRRRDNETTDTSGMIGYRTGNATGSFADFRDVEPTPADNGPRRAVPPAVLDDVFDDPAHGEPGRDRMAVHIVWEIVLLAAVVGVAFLLRREDAGALRGARLDQLLVAAAALGLLTLGAGLTLRTGAVNLALGPVAVASGLHFAEQGDHGIASALGTAAVAALALGLLLGLFVVIFHVPGWAASLAAAAGVIVFIERRHAPVAVQGGFEPTDQAMFLFAGFAALAVLGGLLGTLKAVLRSVGRFRPVADPARRRGTVAAALTAGAIAVSMPLAATAGVLIAAAATGPIRPSSGIDLTALAVGCALLGGTSAYGRRGGVFGTVFAVALVTLAPVYAAARGYTISTATVAAAAIAVGLLVTRLVETFGRPKSAVDDTLWREPAATVARSGSRGEQTDSWSSALPAQSAAAHPDPWETERWNPNGR
jgi:ribose/xylose/arabinose/galactoside ABC-type transport system permease subunit